MTNKERERQIKILLKRFDFAKVQKAMTALKWAWSGQGVPTIANLKEASEYILSELSEESEYLSTGGFRAYWVNKAHLGLEFIVEYQEIDRED